MQSSYDGPQIKVALINQSRSETSFAAAVEQNSLRVLPVGADCGADVVLPGLVSIGACCIVAKHDLKTPERVKESLRRLNDVQERFEVSAGFVVVDKIDTEQQTRALLELQMGLHADGIILSVVQNFEQVLQQLSRLVSMLANRGKRDAQKEYCKTLMEATNSPELGMKILCDFLQEHFDVGPVDCDLLTVSFPTLQKLVSSSLQDILEGCPVDLSTIKALEALFKLQ